MCCFASMLRRSRSPPGGHRCQHRHHPWHAMDGQPHQRPLKFRLLGDAVPTGRTHCHLRYRHHLSSTIEHVGPSCPDTDHAAAPTKCAHVFFSRIRRRTAYHCINRRKKWSRTETQTNHTRRLTRARAHTQIKLRLTKKNCLHHHSSH